MIANSKRKRLKCYLAGPMTGLPKLNFPAFHAEAARLRALGYIVISPAEINMGGAKSWHAAMRKDIAKLVTCDFVATLPGCSRSRGAKVEIRLAKSLDMPVVTSRSLVARHDAAANSLTFKEAA
jgi:hypothetical protein